MDCLNKVKSKSGHVYTTVVGQSATLSFFKLSNPKFREEDISRALKKCPRRCFALASQGSLPSTLSRVFSFFIFVPSCLIKDFLDWGCGQKILSQNTAFVRISGGGAWRESRPSNTLSYSPNPHPVLFSFSFYFTCLSILPACSTVCMLDALESQKRPSDALELEWMDGFRLPQGYWESKLVLCKSNK